MARPQSKQTTEAVAWYLAHPEYTQKRTAKKFGVSQSSLTKKLQQVRYPDGKPPKNTARSNAAVKFMLANPGAVIAHVATAHNIHRVTLCNALAKLRRPCPTCGHPVRPH